MKKIVSISLDKDVVDKLENRAKEERLSFSGFVNRILYISIAEYEKRKESE